MLDFSATVAHIEYKGNEVAAMMQFIVLGQVPGTQFQLTIVGYTVVLLVVGIATGAAGYYWYGARARKQLQHHFDIISLQSLDQA